MQTSDTFNAFTRKANQSGTVTAGERLARRRRYNLPTICLVVATALMGSAPSLAQSNESCLECHRAEHAKDPFDYLKGEEGVDPVRVAASVHAGLDCIDCHTTLDGVTDFPHELNLPPVNCGDCHSDVAEIYVEHGRMSIGQDPDFPKCTNCHGTHYILPGTHRASPVHPSNVAETCRSCHTNTDIIKNHELLRDEPIKLYAGSVHGRAVGRTLEMAATCNDCHSADGGSGKRTAHRILPASDPKSPIYYFNIPDTCGSCHQRIAEDYWEGIHGQLVRRGKVDSPVCTKCHGEHGILPASDLRSPVSAARLAVSTCAPCHESAKLNERYGVPPGRLRSYVDSYHGLKRKAGNVTVANCASCHGSHLILPHTDPQSTIHESNLQHTCGTCHPGISQVMATAPIHATATGLHAGWSRFFAVFYMWLIGITIGSMLLHNMGHWIRHVRLMRKVEYVIRMSASETAQHWVLMISFIILVISGFALRFSESWWVVLLFGWGGGEGFLIRGQIHRAAAIVFMIWAVWHIIFLFTRRGRRYFRDMLAGTDDLRHIKHNALFFLGRKDHEPAFGRFTYMEKCEYWALLWGTVIMTVTGVMLWFDNYFVERLDLPKGVLDVALVIHYYEAWLATLAILVWHLYSTIFSPKVYPMNPAWWSGKMPKRMYAHEHPAGPPLKGRIRKPRVEEEVEAGAKVAADTVSPEEDEEPGWSESTGTRAEKDHAANPTKGNASDTDTQ
jgi:formate dehydrogenase gamma subunit